MFNVTTVLFHNLLQTNPCIRHNFSTQVFRKGVAQLHYVGPELCYIFWPPCIRIYIYIYIYMYTFVYIYMYKNVYFILNIWYCNAESINTK